jgi:CHAT domain-containing protein
VRALEEQWQEVERSGGDESRFERVEALLRERYRELESLQDEEAPSAPVAVPALTAREIQALADEDSLLVFYLLAEPQSFAWTVDLANVEVHLLPGRRELERSARRAVGLLGAGAELLAQKQTAAASRALSERLLAPLADRLIGRRRLIVLADGALHLVPFGGLALPPGLSREEEAEPVLARYEIVSLPSAAFLVQLRRAEPRPTGEVALAMIAAPALGASEAPVREDQARAFSDVSRLRPLAFAGEEAEEILALLPRERRFEALGSAADRGLLESGTLRRFPILHFATHGLFHPVVPELSAVVLSQVDEQGRKQDGFLRAWEVAALDLPAELVVLSACSTAKGREVRGEGLVGLTHAFFVAGARRVLVSHWDVRDRPTARLMALFYRGLLRDDLGPAEALRRAQLAVRAAPGWSAPYYWAGFSLHGDWRWVSPNIA